MSNLINPLQSLIDQAEKLTDSNQVRKYVERIEPSSKHKLTSTILLLDISGSMNEIAYKNMRKIEILRKAISTLKADQIYVFSTLCYEIFGEIPEPEGGTALHIALTVIAKQRPRQTLVISDGLPDDPKQALSTAKKVTGLIHTLYIGSDENRTAIDFMKQLARLGCGTFETCDLNKNSPQQLEQSAIKLLKPSDK